jgi:hypothetical protein
MSPRTALGAGAVLLLAACAPAAAQVPDPAAHALPGWSPLARIADLPRGGAGMLHGGTSLLAPPPRIGEFWTGRNPAGLPWQVTDRHGELGARTRGTNGAYRRPLDAPSSQARGLDMSGWQPVGTGALAGHAAFDEARVDPGQTTVEFHPHGSAPFILTDTTATPARTLSARLDGAGGWRIGNLGVGLSVALEAMDAVTVATRVPRVGRAARPAAALGVLHEVAGGAARLGAYARWSRSDETLRIFALSDGTQIVRLNGLAAPMRFFLGPTATPPYVHRRTEAHGQAGGLTAAGDMRGWAWALNAETGRLEERSTYRQVLDAPADRWDARAHSAAVGVQRLLGDALLTVRGDASTLTGTAYLAGSDTLAYYAEETAARGSAELRWQPASSAWQALGGAGVAYERRHRGDTIATALRTRIEALTAQVRGEVARAVTPDIRVAAGYALTSYAPRGSIPRPPNYPLAMRALVGPETAYYATPSIGHGASLTAQYDVSRATAVRLATRYDRFSPRPGGTTLEMAPQGERSIWGVSLSVVMR